MMEGKQAWDKSIAGATPNASLAENEMMGRS
jgi:hypothetical protein